jgi:hypothetical protein
MLNCYNTYNTHKVGATWITKIKRILSQNVLFLWPCKSRDEDKNTLSRVNTHKTLTMVSLGSGNISALCSTILGTLDARECRILCNLATRSSHNMFCGLRRKLVTAILLVCLENPVCQIQLAIFAQIRTITYFSQPPLTTCHIASGGPHRKHRF